MATERDDEKTPTAAKPGSPIRTADPASPSTQDTPGRPKDSGSRQQTQPDQQTQTGTPELDRRGAGKPGPG
jgi:hypothetical protein